MKRIPLFLGLAALWLLAAPPARASDHADPVVLNPLKPPKDREPRITDLHVFLDKDQNPELPEAKALVIDFCFFPSMPALEPAKPGDKAAGTIELALPAEMQPPATKRYRRPKFNLAGYVYRLSLDLHARLSFANAGDLARYGGTVDEPENIAPEVTLEFELNDDTTVRRQNFTGLINSPRASVQVRTGLFDDPFIFPRFFRTNVIGLVVSIPLECFPAGQRNFLVWGTAGKGGKQLDHVGRSQRTQLPRFDYLNTLPPSEHVAAINRHHTKPSVAWDFGRTFVSPLFGRHPYDSAPDVLIFSRDRPTLFPNGRKLSDDVAAITKETGDTQLWEASYTDDTRFPRATMNDGDFVADAKTGTRTQVARKLYGQDFPYLAPPWTTDELKLYPRPFPALARPNLKDGTWRTLWLAEVAGLGLLTLALLLTMRSQKARWALVLLAIAALCALRAVAAPNLPAMDPAAAAQPAEKMRRLLGGGALLAVLGVAWIYLLGRRWGESHPRADDGFPRGSQALTEEDRAPAASTFEEVRDAVFAEPYYGKAWGVSGQKLLPLYPQNFWLLARGLLTFGVRYAFLHAAKRTVKSRADLRWGPDGRGVRRLLHPMGVCLAGRWKIDAAPEGVAYSGYFAKGAEGRIIARFSTGGSEPRGGHFRSLALVGKIYPLATTKPLAPGVPANFFTQENLGANYTESIREALLTNSPPVSPWRRGKDLFGLLLTAVTLVFADKKGSERQLYEIAELEKPAGTDTACPRFLRLKVAAATPDSGGAGVDFRDEILGLIYDRGNPQPQRALVFDIEVSDAGKKHGVGVEWLSGQHWTRLGSITFTEAAATHNGDFVIHFHHAPWRNVPSDSTTVARPELQS